MSTYFEGVNSELMNKRLIIHVHSFVCVCKAFVVNSLLFDLFQMYKSLKEHKNPKVLSEGLLWIVSAVEDFGTSLIKLKVLKPPSTN